MPAGRPIVDRRGMKFGALVVLELVPRELWRSRDAEWLCGCTCGNLAHVRSGDLQSGGTSSCGCRSAKGEGNLNGNWVHGMSFTSTYMSWTAMKKRCLNPNHVHFDRYGGRGILICSRWLDSFQNFLADMGERPEGTSLDRIDPDGDYEPGNVRWATAREQRHNWSLR